TTAFCLRQLVSHRRSGTPQSFLDIGAGSGILAIAAARLGYAPVEAIDSDAEAVRVACANARQNRVHQHVRIAHQNLCRIPPNKMKRYAVVCANLISTLLLQERARLIARLARGGVLVLAGILNSEFPRIQTAYQSRGLQLIASRKQNEWTSATFRNP